MSEGLTEDKFNYQMLDRMKSDCEYFLGAGNRNPKHLWALSVDAQINAMKSTWKLLKEKPEWCTWEDILEYERKMKENMKKLLLIIGIPGSGKSTKANQIKSENPEFANANIWEADKFFMKDGEYKFNPNILRAAHFLVSEKC